MKKYRVRMTREARTQLSRHLRYIRNVLQSAPAAKAVRDDDTVFVDYIFHDLQDYENIV